MSYTLGKIKTFRGMEGIGINATIMENGKPVCFVMDEGNGGAMDYDWRNPGQTPASFKAHSATAGAAKERFDAFIVAWGTAPDMLAKHRQRLLDIGVAQENLWAPTVSELTDDWVNERIDHYESVRYLQRAAKKATLFRVEGEAGQPGQWRTLKTTDRAAAQRFFDSKYPGKAITVFGEATTADGMLVI